MSNFLQTNIDLPSMKSCGSDILNNHQFGFRYRVLHISSPPKDQLKHKNTITHNAIFLHLEGEIHINWNKYKDVVIKSGDMYFLPRGANVTAYATGERISYIVARLEHNLGSRFHDELTEIKEGKQLNQYKFAPLMMNHSMLRFAESMKEHLLKGIECQQLHNSKLSELQIILKHYYSIVECAHLLYPIIGYNSEFENFILNNYQLSTSIDDLAAKTNMSRSTFDRKFKETFGVTPLKWIERQTRQKIINKASEPNVTVKDIMYEVGIYNHSQFTKLCKRICGVTPTQLIESI